MTSSPASPAARRAVAAAGVLLMTATLAACGGGASKDATSAGGVASSVNGGTKSSGEAVPGLAGAPTAAQDGAGDSSSAGSGSTRTRSSGVVLPNDREVVYRASISVQVKDVGQAAARAESLATGAGGLVAAEQTQTDPRHPRHGQATLTLRVPPAAFTTTLDGLGRLGKELDRQRSAEDVTSQVIDVDSRVRSQQRSVDRVRILLSRARTIGEVVQVESELARREADLESLQAQLKGLKDLTDLATVQVTLTSPEPRPAPPTAKDDGLGFLSGLHGGWDAFLAVVAVALTVLGALVPFLAAAALLGVPLLLVWRSRRHPSAAPPSA